MNSLRLGNAAVLLNTSNVLLLSLPWQLGDIDVIEMSRI
jgi:hypothetical protein